MITYSIIQKSQLEGALRLDAEYYQPEYLGVSRKLSSAPRLDDLSKRITDFGAYSQMNFVEYEKTGIRFLRNQDIEEVFISEIDAIYISDKTYKKLSLKLEENDIITPRVGTLGNSAIVLKKDLPASANQNLAQIKPDTSKIDPYYLSTFLCSRFGRSQFERLATGNVQPWLNLSQIQSVKVFVPSAKLQGDIRAMAIASLEMHKQASSLYSQAENMLSEELGLRDFESENESENELWSVVNLSEVKKVNRIDAEYFQPKYQKILFLIRANGGIALSELATIKKGFEPGSEAYQEEGKLFIRVSSVSKNGIIDKDQKYLNDDLYQKLKKEYEPKVGEILLTKDATPGIAYIVKERVESIISGGILRLKLKTSEIESEYLGLCLNSIIGQMQAERDAGGSVIAHWKPEQIKNLLIPILPKPTQQKIAELVQKSHEARKKARQLLEEAKYKVGELIEKGK